MKHLRFHGATLAVAVLGFATQAEAADSVLPFSPYIRADLGYAIGGLSGSNGDIVNGPGFGNDFGNSGSYGGGIGFKLPAAIGPATFRIDVTGSDNASLGGGNHTGVLGDGTPISARVQVNDITYLATLYADIDIGGPITPFIGFGGGGARNKVGTIQFSNPSGTFAIVNGNSHYGAVWSATAGASYAMGKGFTVDLAYRYTDTGKVNSGTSFTDITQSPAAVQTLNQPISSNLNLHQFTVSLRYSF